jgi:hypothetical protein
MSRSIHDLSTWIKKLYVLVVQIGKGYQAFNLATRVRIPPGTPYKIKRGW